MAARIPGRGGIVWVLIVSLEVREKVENNLSWKAGRFVVGAEVSKNSIFTLSLPPPPRKPKTPGIRQQTTSCHLWRIWTLMQVGGLMS